ncbi:hypothetical protein [Mycoplasma anserisalpingitidis]|uniref:Uncharacterized protein n=1 Tax=Mycoplasma anserisalpingitidis TaxID=519450 RepID=A0A5B8K5I9_9MOLU|nr:hypothetical protein [Mycoplasma anserisalpingitidis]QDY88265.1 hypothetical protein FOY43_01115 [Mycoplasma anserisalpingitidis]
MNLFNLEILEKPKDIDIITKLGGKITNFVLLLAIIVTFIIIILTVFWILFNWFKMVKASDNYKFEQAKKSIKIGLLIIMIFIFFIITVFIFRFNYH